MLKKQKDEPGKEKEIKKRQRKNREQIKLLENEYTKRQNWDRDYIMMIAKKLGLRDCQVYKWHWDQVKKEEMDGYHGF